MCGRFAITKPELISAAFKLREEIALVPRYNIVPSQEIPIIKADGYRTYRLAIVKWGLIPFWAKEAKIGYKLINARAETLADEEGGRWF